MIDLLTVASIIYNVVTIIVMVAVLLALFTLTRRDHE